MLDESPLHLGAYTLTKRPINLAWWEVGGSRCSRKQEVTALCFVTDEKTRHHISIYMWRKKKDQVLKSAFQG